MEEWKLRLKQAREAKKLNKTAFAKAVGVSNPTVTDWEKSVADGGIKEITGIKLMKVCLVLDISVHWLYYGREDQSKMPGQAPTYESRSGPAVATDDDQKPSGGLADALKLTCETAPEMRLLSVYRLTNDDGRAAIDSIVEQIRLLLDVKGAQDQG